MSNDDMANELARRDRAASLGNPDNGDAPRDPNAAPVMEKRVYADGSERHGAPPFPDESPKEEAARLNREANPLPPQDTFARQQAAEAAAAQAGQIQPKPTTLDNGETLTTGQSPVLPVIASPADAHAINEPETHKPGQPISIPADAKGYEPKMVNVDGQPVSVPGNLPPGIVTGTQVEGDATSAGAEHSDAAPAPRPPNTPDQNPFGTPPVESAIPGGHPASADDATDAKP